MEAANPFTAGRTRAEQQWYFNIYDIANTEEFQKISITVQNFKEYLY